MVLSTDKERIHALLKDTIMLLCKNGLSFTSEFSVEALIGITLDKDSVFLVNINEMVRSEAGEKAAAQKRKDSEAEQFREEESTSSSEDGTDTPSRKRRKRLRKLEIKEEEAIREADDVNTPFNTDVLQQPSQVMKTDIENDDSVCDTDIIVIKEEVGDDWAQLEDVSHFPSTSGLSSTSDSFSQLQGPFPQQPQDVSFDWSVCDQSSLAGASSLPSSVGPDNNQIRDGIVAVLSEAGDELQQIGNDPTISKKIAKTYDFRDVLDPRSVCRYRMTPRLDKTSSMIGPGLASWQGL